MPPTTAYSKDLGDREPLSAMSDAVARYRQIADAWTPAHFERTYALDKWTARQILIHLAQTELALGSRARMALATPNYVAQSFDQDRWMARESGPNGPSGLVALNTLLAVSAMNRALFTSLSDADRATSFSHPEYGALTVDWLIHQMAGHQIHHLQQLDQIARQ